MAGEHSTRLWDIPPEKRCGRCKKFKTLDCFYNHKKSKKQPSGLQGYCKECVRLSISDRRQKRKQSGDSIQDYKRLYKKKRWAKLLKQYGITKEQYDELEKKQNGLCAICGNPETLYYKDVLCKLVVDHEHGSDCVRGLLCRSCNVGLGNFKDDTRRLQRAISYLESAQQLGGAPSLPH